MSRRLIHTAASAEHTSTPTPLRVAKVYRDAEWQEYRVKFYAMGIPQADADYHTADRTDALSTARRYAEGAQ